MEKTTRARQLSKAIALKTAAFSNPRFKKYVEENKPAIVDRLHRECINSRRDSEEYIRFAETVLYDQEIDEEDFVGGWFEDILGTVINELDKVNMERCRKEETLNIVSYLKGKITVPMDERFKYYLETYQDEIKSRARQKIGYYDAPVDQMRFMDSVLDGKEISAEKRSLFADIAGTVHEIIREYRAVYNSIKDEKSQMQAKNGFDIYEWAKKFPGADYFDQGTGYIYRCADYSRAVKFGLPTPGIAVVDSMTGALIGYAAKEN